MSTRVTVVGIGAEGWVGLSEASRAVVEDADVVLGAARHLATLPETAGQLRESWPSPLREGLEAQIRRYDRTDRIVALASGDPMVSGIGSTLVELLGADAVEVLPSVSSVALARARMRWSNESVEVVSLVGRPLHLALRPLAPGRRLLILSSDGGTPRAVADLLVEAGFGESTMTVLADLGAPYESVSTATAERWPDGPSPRLHVLAVECHGTPVVHLGWTAGLPDDAFEHDGQLTKRDARASALARLAPQPGQLLWDVGAGAGSIGIEWMRAHLSCHAVAVEAREERAHRAAGNAARLGVPGLQVVVGHAPEALRGLTSPHAIFVGGGATEPGVLEACWSALRPGGRMVVHGVTLETEAVLARWYAEQGGELTRLHVEHAAPIGSFTGWKPSRVVTQWSVTT